MVSANSFQWGPGIFSRKVATQLCTFLCLRCRGSVHSVNYNKVISSNTNNSLTEHVINNIFINVLRLNKFILKVNFSYENSIILVFTEITETSEWHSADAKGSCM